MRFSLSVVIVLAVFITSQQQKAKTQQSQRSAAADQRGTQDQPLTVKVLPTAKTPEEATQEKQDRDTKAANDGNVVKLTAVLAAVAFLQLLVYSYQAYKLRQTVKSAGEQSSQMERHVTEAARSAVAMEKIAKTIEVGNKAIMRAYLTVTIGGAVFQERSLGQLDKKFCGAAHFGEHR